MCEISGTVCSNPEGHPDLFRERRRTIRRAYGRNAVLDILPEELPVVLTTLKMVLGPPTPNPYGNGFHWPKEVICLCHGRRQVHVLAAGPWGPHTDSMLYLLWQMLEPDIAEVPR